MQRWGATVRLLVALRNVGECLHRLEWHADIHLLARRPSLLEPVEEWTLRSDCFPATWEGMTVRAKIHRDCRGIWRFVEA